MKAKKLLAALLADHNAAGDDDVSRHLRRGARWELFAGGQIRKIWMLAISRAVAGDVIELTQDIEITDTYTIDTTVPITINFGDYPIDATKVDIEKDSVVIAEGADVTFTAGTGGIKGKKNCLTNYGGTVTLNGGAYSTKLIGRGSALYNGSGTHGG